MSSKDSVRDLVTSGNSATLEEAIIRGIKYKADDQLLESSIRISVEDYIVHALSPQALEAEFKGDLILASQLKAILTQLTKRKS